MTNTISGKASGTLILLSLGGSLGKLGARFRWHPTQLGAVKKDFCAVFLNGTKAPNVQLEGLNPTIAAFRYGIGDGMTDVRPNVRLGTFELHPVETTPRGLRRMVRDRATSAAHRVSYWSSPTGQSRLSCP